MKKVALGRTGLRISPLVYGTLPLGPLQANLSPAAGGYLIRQALESGVNMLDTAELYETYPHVREGLKGYAGRVVLATKTHAPNAAQARSHVERALRELGVGQLDIVHLHGARLADPFVERAAVFEELLRMKDEGKIAHLGLSSHYITAIRKAADHPAVDVLHPLVNRSGMGILDGDAAEMAAAISAAAAAGKGVYAMKALAGGNLIGSARESLRFVLGIEGVHAVAVGMLSEAEIQANLKLFDGQDVEETVWARLESQKRRLRIMERFCTGCGACVEACTNHALTVEQKRVRLDNSACILCGYCAAACPQFIIRVI